MTKTNNKTGFVILISMVATIGGFLFGFDSGVINGTVSGLREAFNSDAVGTGFNVASMLLGCAAGAFVAGRLADRFGRRTILLFTAGFFIVSAWGSGVAGSSAEFIFYRVLGGLAVGAASILAPAYISEVAPARHRGMLSSIQQIAIVSGLFACFVSNYLIAGHASGSMEVLAWGFQAWRWMFWVELIPAFIFLFALLLIPESPRFLVACGKNKEALEVLSKVMGETEAVQKLAEIEQTLSSDHRPALKDVMGRFGFRPIVWVGIGLASFQQLTGICVVFYYGSVLWQAVGFTESHSLLINVVIAALSLGSCVVASMVIDRIGRKPLLLIGSIGMALTLGTMAFIFGTATAGTGGSGTLILEGSSGVVALVAANLYVIFFNFSWGPVMWVMLGEMFPNQMRGSALGLSGFAQWIANFAIVMTFPIMLAGIGLGLSYTFYAVCSVISFFFVLKFVRETKGIELEDMKG